MTINGDRDSARQALRMLMRDSAQPDGLETRKAGQKFFGRSDALELVREVVAEERLLRTLQADISSELAQASASKKRALPRARPALSLVSGASTPRVNRAWLRMAIAAAALLAVGIAFNWGTVRDALRTVGNREKPVYRSFATNAAELDTLSLPDGSRAILAPNSSLSYALSPHRGPREVTLEGEAYFDVIHNESRPFRVETRHALVTDLGTTFVVREYITDGRARVAVRSGAASVQARKHVLTPPLTMRPGDGAYVDSRGEISRFSGDPESYGAWTSGKIAFDGAALPEVLDRLGRWYDVEFRLADSTLSTQYFTGEFRSVPLAEALAILGPIVHARFAQEGRVVEVTAIPAGR